MKMRRALGIGIIFLLLVTFVVIPCSAEPKVSKPGVYAGYSQEIYDGWKRFSQYVTVRDGTKIAIDIYRPTLNGQVVTAPLPVLYQFTPYRRAFYTTLPTGEKTLNLNNDRMPDYIAKYGYVVVIGDVRGMGASYGFRQGANGRTEAMDAHDVIEWLGDQPWSDGKVGAWGLSYYGQTVLEAISTMPQHLKAAWIAFTDFNKFDGWSRGAIDRGSAAPEAPWTADLVSAPVDGDVDGDGDGNPDQLFEAAKQHQNNTSFNGLLKAVPFRNSTTPLYEESTGYYWQDASASTYLDQIVKSRVPAYIVGGWCDIFKRDSVMTFVNWRSPVKLLMGPWRHGESMATPNPGSFDTRAEMHRFFDFWLKGIKNGVMDGPPIYYNAMITPVAVSSTMTAPVSKEWRFAWKWPIPHAKETTYFLKGERSGSAPSVNDGTLSTTAPRTEDGKDDYQVVYGIKTNVEPLPSMPMPMATELDQKGLTYTTAALTADMDVTGHPVVNLWVSSTATDGDFLVFLEDVDQSGTSWWVTDGRLRASMRKTQKPPYNFMGLPWHRSFEEDVTPIVPGKPTKLVIDMAPTSYVFQAGHRIRLTMTNSVAPLIYLNQISPPPLEAIYRNAVYHSSIKLPIVHNPSGK